MIRNLVLDFILYFVTAYIIWDYPTHVTWAQGTTPNTLYIIWESKKKNFHGKQFTTVTTHKNVRNYYNEKCTYNANKHCNLLYALKVWICLNSIRNRRLFFA